MILACESCGEHRRHHERISGNIATLEERSEFVCDECDGVTASKQTRCPVVHVRFSVVIELPEKTLNAQRNFRQSGAKREPPSKNPKHPITEACPPRTGHTNT